ncbi:MAG: hemerythrin domain-containing protein [Blastocatellia bacterium]
MSRPTQILKHEHRLIEQALRALDGMVLAFQAGVPVTPEALEQMLDFITNFADGYHHAREETILFPMLEPHGAVLKPEAVDFLRREHERERRLIHDLNTAMRDVRDGTAGAIEHFLMLARQFGDHLIEHIRREDSLLFTLIEELLPDTVRDAMLRRLQEPAGKPDLMGHYEKLAASLERDWVI